jgi:hypothetical protein
VSIDIPTLAPSDEDVATAEAISALPTWLSDRNASALEVKTLEGAGAFYGTVGYQADTMPPRVRRQLLGVVGLTQQSDETIDELIDRAAADVREDVSRAVTAQEFAERAEQIDSPDEVVRATVTAEEHTGTMVIHVIDEEYNEFATLDSSFPESVDEELEPLNRVGHQIVTHAPVPRLIVIGDCAVEFEDGADPQAVRSRAESMLVDWVDYHHWEWGRPLYANEVYARLDRVDGIDRVIDFWVYQAFVQTTNNWGGPYKVDSGESFPAGANGRSNDLYGMLHWGKDYNPPSDYLNLYEP